MKRKKSYIFIVFSFLFILSAFAGLNNVQAASSFDDKEAKSGVEANKSWVIKFNKELNKSTVNDSNFIVTDESGQSVPINVATGSDGKSVVVSPKTQYTYGKTYNLTINNVESSSGVNLSKPEKMEFTIKNNLNKEYTVCIDAGHGGYDSGNISKSGIKEKDIDLSVALKLGKLLKNNGIKVVYTRDSDSVSWNKDNELKSRFDISNNGKADYFVSIHCNAYPENPATNGIETYYSDSDAIGKKLAESVQSELISKTGRTDRGIKVGAQQHEILRGSVGNSIMVELGFITNEGESAALSSEDFQEKSANAIANGVLKSLSLINKDVTISSIADIPVSVAKGDTCTLPVNVSASMSDGSTRKVGVIWKTKTVDTSSIGTYTYEGTAAGYSKSVKLVLTIGKKQDPKPNPPTGTVICIDPGHGRGKDTGASGINGLQEDDVTLAVGLKVGKILEDRGITVVYTRTKDERSTPMSVTDSLQMRCNTANDASANYFVSIHCNSFDESSADGTETLVNESNPESKKLAQAIQNSIVNEVGTYSRGLKDGNWLYVVNNTNMPAVLTELGFLTNPSDASKLSSEAYREKYAQAIANGIFGFLGK